jgi:hypothetical protein
MTTLTEEELFASGTEAPASSIDEDQEPIKEPTEEAKPESQEEPKAEEPKAEETKAEGGEAKAESKDEPKGESPLSTEARGILRDLLDERERRQKAEQEREAAARAAQEALARVQAMERLLASKSEQHRPDPIDPLADPQGALSQTKAELAREMSTGLMELSLETAQATFGPDTVRKAFEEILTEVAAGRRQDYDLIMQSPATVGPNLVRWYQKREREREIGPDLDAYVQKKREEALSDKQFLAKAFEAALQDETFLAKAVEAARAKADPSRPNTTVQLPPSIARAQGTPANSGGSETGAMTEEELFEFGTRRRRKSAA